MRWRILWAATISLSISLLLNTSGRAAVGDVGIHPVPCADQSWTYDDPSFEALPGAKASFGRYDGGLYRVEIPEDWNGELVLWAHGLVDNKGAQGPVRARFAGTVVKTRCGRRRQVTAIGPANHAHCGPLRLQSV